MKTVFICLAGIAAVLTGCIDLEAPPLAAGSSSCGELCGESADELGDGTGSDGAGGPDDTATDEGTTGACTTCGGHGLSGELMLIVNGRLTSADALFQVNIPLADDGTYLGSAIYLYDPNATCEDGGTACRLAHVGHVRLDDALGAESVDDGSLKKFSLRDVAWSPTHGLWGVSFDVQNDEWGIVRVDVPDWQATEQELPLERWNILPAPDPDSPDSDGCYWQESVSGLGFFGDELLLGVRGLGGLGIANDGMVFRVDLGVTDEGWCQYVNDPTQDPHFYACDVLCHPYADFGPALGIAGDLETTPQGDAAIGLVRAEDPSIMPFDRAEIWRIDPPIGSDPSQPVPAGLYVENIELGLDIEGLARIDGVLYGVDVLARVWVLDDVENAVAMHEDLGVHFDEPEQSLKIRGATRVVVEPPPDP